MSRELQRLEKLFNELVDAPHVRFPAPRKRLEAPQGKGVYIIRSPRGKVLHVGSTPRAKKGIAQRLKGHIQGNSSFVGKYLDGNSAELRNGYTFQCIVVDDPRTRALLEAYAIGHLCPAHIGHS